MSDTSPIFNLALIGRLDLLRAQFDAVLIPEAVRIELERLPNADGKSKIAKALLEKWLRSHAVSNQRLAAALANDLDRGEAETIALATEIEADVVLIDEKEGRSIARQAGLAVRGILGVLLRAKASGEVTSIREEIRALRDRAGFFVAPSLEAEVIRSAGE